MAMRKLIFSPLLLMTVSACANLQTPPSEEVAARYGRYCEQLGNLKDSPSYVQCLIKQRDTYK